MHTPVLSKSSPRLCRLWLSAVVWVAIAAGSPPAHAAAGSGALVKPASWQTLDQAGMLKRLDAALQPLALSEQQVDETLERFQAELRSGDALQAIVRATGQVVPSVERLSGLALEDPALAATWFASADPLAASFDQLPATIEASVRTWLARELVHLRHYDEALPVFADVEASDCIDPAAVLFYRGVCRHGLLMKQDALGDLKRLLENDSDAPVRFVRLAQLMIADIKPLEEDSLDEISRLMTDVTRRLDLGRANTEVQQREQTIIDKLSKLIDQIEEQQQQQQQQQQQAQQASGSQSQSGQQGQPMDDSRVAGANGQGDVDRKNIGDRAGWGNLPPAEREEALQHISRELPTHYREAIEAYFRKLATDN